MDATWPPEVDALLARSHALGADPRVTNYGGGNTSCKAAVVDPVTGDGDRGAVREGLRRRPRHAPARGPGHPARSTGCGRCGACTAGSSTRTRWSTLFEHCRWARGGAAPSIDTAMHALVDAPHVDHLHPDAVIALAAAADGEALTKECFGRELAWVPWRRPGFELGLQIAALAADNPGLRGVVLGGHGLTTWADTSEACQATVARRHRPGRALHRRARPPRSARPGAAGLRAAAARRAPAAGRRAGAPHPGPVLDRPARRRPPRPTATSCSTSLAREAVDPARAAGHVVPRPLHPHQGPAAAARPPADRARRRPGRPPARAARRLPRRLRRLLPAPRRPPTRRRCAAPTP